MRRTPRSGRGIGAGQEPAHQEFERAGFLVVVEVSRQRRAECVDRGPRRPGSSCPGQLVQIVEGEVGGDRVLEAAAEDLEGVADTQDVIARRPFQDREFRVRRLVQTVVGEVSW